MEALLLCFQRFFPSDFDFKWVLYFLWDNLDEYECPYCLFHASTVETFQASFPRLPIRSFVTPSIRRAWKWFYYYNILIYSNDILLLSKVCVIFFQLHSGICFAYHICSTRVMIVHEVNSVLDHPSQIASGLKDFAMYPCNISLITSLSSCSNTTAQHCGIVQPNGSLRVVNCHA